MKLNKVILTIALIVSPSFVQAREPVLFLQKGGVVETRGIIVPGSEVEKNYTSLVDLPWHEQFACVIGLAPSAPLVYVQQGSPPLGYIRFDTLKKLQAELLPEMRGTLRWMDGDAFLMGSNAVVLKQFLIASGVQGKAEAFHNVVPGSGMLYVVPAKHLNARQREVCLSNTDSVDVIVAKAAQRKIFRKESAYNMWELLAFPLDTPLRFYRCESTADISSLLHDTFLSMKSMEGDEVANDFKKNTQKISNEEVILAIKCFYEALNKSDKEIRAMLQKVATKLAKLPDTSSEAAVRQAMVDLFCTRIMASHTMETAVMELAGEIAESLKGPLLDELTKTLTKQVALAFADATKDKNKKDTERYRARSRDLFIHLHKAFLGYFTNSTGITRWVAYYVGPYVDTRALVLDKVFSAAVDGLGD